MSWADGALRLSALKPTVSQRDNPQHTNLITNSPPDPPKVEVRKSKSGPLLESEDDVRLYCDVDASPEAEIAWLKSSPGQVCEPQNDHHESFSHCRRSRF